MLRAERAYKINSWSENPPARTRRIIGNIELMGRGEDTLSVLSNFHLYYARPGAANTLYSGQRRDTLLSDDNGFRIKRREVVLGLRQYRAANTGPVLLVEGIVVTLLQSCGRHITLALFRAGATRAEASIDLVI